MTDLSAPDTPRNRGDHNAPHETPVLPSEDVRTILINKVSWGAVLAGVAIALAVMLLLNMLGIGIGASTLDPGAGAAENPSAEGFSIGASLWWGASTILASFAGGYAAGRLAGQPKESSASWHGLVTWALTTLVVLYLLTSVVGGLIGGAYNTLTSVAGGAASTAGGAVQTAAQAAAPTLASSVTDPFAAIEQAIRGTTNNTDPASLQSAAIASLKAAFTGDENQAQQAREGAAQAIARAQNVPIEQARTQVQQYEEQYKRAIELAKTQATEAADVAAKAVSRGALLGSLVLLLGALAGWFGGRMGAVEPTITARTPIRSGLSYRLRQDSREAAPDAPMAPSTGRVRPL